MDEYKSNSHKSRDGNAKIVPEKKAVKVIEGEARLQKKNKFQRFADALISEDVSSVREYILKEVVVPIAKDAVFDIVEGVSTGFRNSISRILYGEERGHRANVSRVSYRSYYDKRSDRREWNGADRVRNVYGYDRVILETRGEAEEVLDRMREAIESYGLVSVADMYDFVGIVGESTDNKYGWTNLRNAEVIRIRDGYTLKLPKAAPID